MKSPVAHDPMLQPKIDKLCANTDTYFLEFEISRQEDQVEYNERIMRSLEKEIDRSHRTINALKQAVNTLENNEKKTKK